MTETRIDLPAAPLSGEEPRRERVEPGANASSELTEMLGNYDPEGGRPLVRWATDSEKGTPCFVHHPDAGGECRRPCAVSAYGIPFCETHGAEAVSGALEEAYHDAAWFFERFRNPHVPDPHPAVDRELKAAAGRLDALCCEAESVRDGALRRAYPLVEGRVCEGTLGRDPNDLPDAPCRLTPSSTPAARSTG